MYTLRSKRTQLSLLDCIRYKFLFKLYTPLKILRKVYLCVCRTFDFTRRNLLKRRKLYVTLAEGKIENKMTTRKVETFEQNIREGRNYKINCYDNSKQSEQNIRGNRIIYRFLIASEF